MRSKQRRQTAIVPNLFSLLETPRQKSDRLAATGNYATRTIRKWIRSDPFTLQACFELAEDVKRMPVSRDVSRAQIATLRTVELTLQLIGWFRRAVREEEPSASYADYLCGSIDVEWGMLAAELLAREWPEGS